MNDTTYKIRKFVLTFDIDTNKPRRNWVGYLGENYGIVKDIELAKEYTKQEFEKQFSLGDIEKMKQNVHEKYFLIQRNKELDAIFEQVKSFKKRDFSVNKKHFISPFLNGDITTGIVFDDKYGPQMEIKWDKVVATWGKNTTGVKNIFIDKMRRLFDYNDPYKHLDFDLYYNPEKEKYL